MPTPPPQQLQYLIEWFQLEAPCVRCGREHLVPNCPKKHKRVDTNLLSIVPSTIGVNMITRSQRIAATKSSPQPYKGNASQGRIIRQGLPHNIQNTKARLKKKLPSPKRDYHHISPPYQTRSKRRKGLTNT